MAAANLVLRFIVEVLGIAALAYAGFHIPGSALVKAVAGIGAPLVLIIVWALVVAPNTSNGLQQVHKDLIGTVLLLLAAGALALTGRSALGIGFAILVGSNAALMFTFGAGSRVVEAVSR
jgi:hypothetical protein